MFLINEVLRRVIDVRTWSLVSLVYYLLYMMIGPNGNALNDTNITFDIAGFCQGRRHLC